MQHPGVGTGECRADWRVFVDGRVGMRRWLVVVPLLVVSLTFGGFVVTASVVIKMGEDICEDPPCPPPCKLGDERS